MGGPGSGRKKGSGSGKKKAIDDSHDYFMHNRKGSAISRKNPYKLGKPDMTAKEYNAFWKARVKKEKGK